MERKLAEFTLDAFSKAEYYCWKADRDYQESASDAEFLKEHGKDLLATVSSEIRRSREGKVSEAELERLARSSEKWELHQRGYFAAMRKANELKTKCRAAQRYFDCIQSGLSYRRAEMHRTGAQDG